MLKMYTLYLIFWTLLAQYPAQNFFPRFQTQDLFSRLGNRVLYRGRYEDNSGQYQPDDSGKYVPDNLGGYDSGARDYCVENVKTSGSVMPNEYFRKSIPPVSIRPVSQRLGRGNEFNAAVIKFDKVQSPNGYSYIYQTENGINAEEQGKLENIGSNNEAIRTTGSFSYTGPNNIIYTVEYRADENGFQPKGAHIP